jgi:hypothetical protein
MIHTSSAVLAVATTMHLVHAVQAAPCSGQIVNGVSITGRTPYSPFNAQELMDTYRLTIRNTGSEPCSFALAFRDSAKSMKLGGAISYSIMDNAERPVVFGISPAIPANANLMSSVARAGTTADIEYHIVIPRGQMASPGIYEDQINADIYAVTPRGQVVSPPLATSVVIIKYTIPDILHIKLAGGGASTTIRLEELLKGRQGGVNIQVHSNLGYRLVVSSEHGGKMELTPSTPASKNWFVPYEASLDGRPLNLSTGSSAMDFGPTQIIAANHSFGVTVGEAGGVRAGKYKDTITIEITDAMP